MANKWIVLEGIDGAGTTTQAELIAAALRASGARVHTTAEPSTGPIGVQLRRALRGDWLGQGGARLGADTLALLFAADRTHHVRDEVRPALLRGEWVVCDRYVHSSFAYQGVDLPMDWVVEINAKAPIPDCTIFVDTSVEEALRRIDARGEARELFEDKATLERVRARYLEAFARRPEHAVTIDGDGDPEVVLQAILSVVGVGERSQR